MVDGDTIEMRGLSNARDIGVARVDNSFGADRREPLLQVTQHHVIKGDEDRHIVCVGCVEQLREPLGQTREIQELLDLHHKPEPDLARMLDRLVKRRHVLAGELAAEP